MSILALFGGTPVRSEPFPAYRVIGDEEKAAVAEVMDSGILSRYLGTWHADFYGGPKVQAFEAAWAEKFEARFAISVNSATSGLYAAVGAAGVGPGDEVIVSPYTMCASATAPMVFNAVPIFADIDPKSYCLSPESIRAKITPRTKAIIVVHIFGQAADMDPIMEIAEEFGLVVIEDCAQAPLARYKGRMVGTIGHMGVFSLNYHKHIHTGEGGVITTNDEAMAQKCQLIRNHAEGVVAGIGASDLTNMIGFNYRLGEIESAIGLCQLEKLPLLITERQANVKRLEVGIGGLPGLGIPEIAPGCEHVYYVHALNYDEEATGVPRKMIVEALKAEMPVTALREGEGPLIRTGYLNPLYNLPIFQKKIGYGSVGCPFACPHYEGEARYDAADYPNVEHAQATIIMHEFIRPPMTADDIQVVVDGFEKVWSNLDELRRNHNIVDHV